MKDAPGVAALRRSLGRVGGMAELNKTIRASAAEAAIDSDGPAALAAAGEAWLRAEAAEKALKVQIATLIAEKKAAADAVKALREGVLEYMQENGKRADVTDQFEFAVENGRPSVVITDISKVPARFMKVAEPEPMLRELHTAVYKDGEVVEGVERSNGANYATIKRRRHSS